MPSQTYLELKMPEVAVWKIVEAVGAQVRTLFHGVNGTRTLPCGVWVRAVERPVRDGTGKTTYLSGFHVFVSRAACRRYLGRFTSRRDRLRVVGCLARDLRPKTHSPSPVMLAREIRLG